MRRLTLAALLVVLAASCAKCGGGGGKTVPVVDKLVLAEGKAEVSLLFVGDLSVARGITEVIDDPKKGNGDPAYPFKRIQPLLTSFDMVFANIECVLSDSTAEEATMKTYRIRADTKYASALKEAGVDVVSVANNHAMDFGAQGFSATLATVRNEGLFPIGHLDKPGTAQPVRIVNVGDIKVGFLGYNQHGDEYKHDDWRPSSANYRIDHVIKDIKAARPLVDFLVVSVHGGLELSHEATDWQITDSRKAIDAGADAWIGHHPHVAQPWTVYKGKVIAYSLGDFLFDKSSPWLVHRNRPRFYLSMKLKKDSAGKVVATHEFLTGDQEASTYRPFEAKDFFDVASFQEPKLEGTKLADKTFRDLLPTTKVERVKGKDVVACDRWEKRRMPIKGHAYRWLAPRWGCGEAKTETQKPWETIAPTAELYQGKMKRGIWAHPHKGGPLRLRFLTVELGSKIEGFAAIPDWGIELEDAILKRNKPATPPVKLWAYVDGPKEERVKPLEQRVEVPIANGIIPISIDTSALAGQKRDVVVEIEGGSGDVEGRFTFDLWVTK